MSQINTNNYSLNAQRSLANNSRGLATALERLSVIPPFLAAVRSRVG